MEPYLVSAVILVASVLLLKWASRRALVICELRVDDGKTTVLRGGVAPSVSRDLSDVVKHAELDGVRIRVMRDRDRARVETKGDLDAATLQRIRNVVGSVPLTRLKAKG